MEVEGDKAEDAVASAAPAEVPIARPSRESITTIGRLVSQKITIFLNFSFPNFK